MKKVLLLLVITFLFTSFSLGQTQITHTGNMSLFPDWSYIDTSQGLSSGNYYIILLKNTSNIISPTIDFSTGTYKTLVFKARTYGGTNTTENQIFIDISTNNGTNWITLASRTPTTNTLTQMTSIDISSYTSTQIKIKFYMSGTSNTIGAGIDDIGSEGILPIKLETFTSVANGNSIKLKWKTAEEINNNGFEIYRNDNKIGFIKGNNKPSEYEYTDNNLQVGKYKYKLKQIDYNGNYEWFETNETEVLPNKKFDFYTYPNPFNPTTIVEYSLNEATEVQIKLYDITGRLIQEVFNGYQKEGYYKQLINGEKLNSGLYIVEVKTTKYIKSKKLILIK